MALDAGHDAPSPPCPVMLLDQPLAMGPSLAQAVVRQDQVDFSESHPPHITWLGCKLGYGVGADVMTLVGARVGALEGSGVGACARTKNRYSR